MIYHRFQIILPAWAEPCTRRSVSLYMVSLFALNFKSLPKIMLATENIRCIFCFLIKSTFVTPSKRSPLARSIPAPKFTNIAMPTFALFLTCNTALFWWPRRFKDVSVVRACAGGGISRHVLRPWRRFLLFYWTFKKSHERGWIWIRLSARLTRGHTKRSPPALTPLFWIRTRLVLVNWSCDFLSDIYFKGSVKNSLF